ncbi:MAG: hypothetical protein HKO59_17145 [Phycisphaerales bacterium]|nr:hypothetical protein [Phycisphaerales bacterium]NNM27677.1 hypothetical protein [Phycisphaerales bacterium]
MQRTRLIGAALACAVFAGPATAAINLEFRPLDQTVFVGDTVRVELYAVSDTADSQSLSGIDAIFAWDPGFLTLLGLDETGSAAGSAASFPADPFNLNESNPPADGDGIMVYFAPLGTPVMASAAGTFITTFEFEALSPTPATPVDLLLNGGSPEGMSRVLDGDTPGLDVLGTLSGATVEIIIPGPGAVAMLALAGLVGTRRRRR